MKKILLSFSLLATVFATKAQTVFNEFYTDPNDGKQEFFELYNTAPGNVAENLNCYTLITWYKDGNTTGFYVLDFPNLSVAPKSFFTGAATSPFNVQAKTNITANFGWDTLNVEGSLKDYRRNGTGYDAAVSVPAGFNDFFHTNSGGADAAYAMFLFKDGVYINGFMGGINTTTIPSDITSMPDLPVDMKGTCPDFTVDWSNNPLISQAENTTANGGTDNGFIRDRDGKCGSWKKSSSQVQHTPGTTNGSATGLVGSIETAELFGTCPTSLAGSINFTADVTGLTGDATATNTFPVQIQIYYDYAPFGNAIGGEDIFHASFTQLTLAEAGHTFAIVPPNQKIFVIYKSVLGCFEKTLAVGNPCIGLPVKFKSFTATRTNSTNVAVKWETLSEENAAGFAVERNVRGTWEQVAYIPSQAAGGNSNSALTYQLNDLNAAKGVSQYRIRQEDLDGAAKLSDIRSVRGEGQKGSTIVYPNPSSDGKVNVVFAGGEITKRNVSVQDMSGRTVKQWSNYSNNNIQIENLTPGLYTIRIVDIGTGEQSVEKIVVNKR